MPLNIASFNNMVVYESTLTVVKLKKSTIEAIQVLGLGLRNHDNHKKGAIITMGKPLLNKKNINIFVDSLWYSFRFYTSLRLYKTSTTW